MPRVVQYWYPRLKAVEAEAVGPPASDGAHISNERTTTKEVLNQAFRATQAFYGCACQPCAHIQKSLSESTYTHPDPTKRVPRHDRSSAATP